MSQVPDPDTAAKSWLAINGRIDIETGSSTVAQDQRSKVIPIAINGSGARLTAAAYTAVANNGEAMYKFFNTADFNVVSADSVDNILSFKVNWQVQAPEKPSSAIIYSNIDGYVGQVELVNSSLAQKSAKFALYMRRSGDMSGKGIAATVQSKCDGDAAWVDYFSLNAPNPDQEYQLANVVRVKPNSSCLLRVLRSGQSGNGFAKAEGEHKMVLKYQFK